MSTLSPQLQSLLDNRLRYLPEIVGTAIRSIDWSTELITIGRHYGLHIDDMEDLQTVVLKSMIGLIAPQDFESSLIAATAVSPANAEKIIHEINQKIFEPIHEIIMHPHQHADALQKSGIVVEIPENEPTPSDPVQSSVEKPEFEIPASPEPAEKLPVFSDYFRTS